MAIGWTPRYTEFYPLENLSKEHFLALGIEAALLLEWRVTSASEAGFIAYTNNGHFSFNAELQVRIEGDNVQLTSSSTGNEMMDWGRNKKTVKKFMDKFHELQPTFSKEHLDVKYEEYEQSFVPEEEDPLKLPPETAKDSFYNFLALFKPVPGYFVTPILINLNLLVFLVMACTGMNIMEPDSAIMLKWGANFKPLTLEGGWWRLITNCFLHWGILHLLLNMYALSYIGLLLEPFLGRTRYITAYLATGVAASLASLWWHDYTISAGASGAIFGMYGVFLALLSTNLIEKETRKALLVSIGIFVGYNLLYGVKGGIDNAAHIGGLVSGLVFGYVFVPGLLKPDSRPLKWGVTVIIAVFTVASTFVAYKTIPQSDMAVYQEQFNQFTKTEALALRFYQLPDSATKEQKLDAIKNGIANYQLNIELVKKMDKALKLPDVVHFQNQKMLEYCQLRIKLFELVGKTISENTDRYKEEIDEYGGKVQAILDEMSGKSK
jgi:rhomboid protease GluP